jgi:hypothetical protein
MSVAQADRNARLLERLFQLLPDSEATHPEWRRLLVTHSISGVQVHDARLVALMNVHSVTRILTLNGSDFSRYSTIVAEHPSVAAARS